MKFGQNPTIREAGEAGWQITHATSQKIGKARLNWSAGTFDAGTIWVLRRVASFA